jgi:predicted lipoprotein with Yx(FWY)xxD motif
LKLKSNYEEILEMTQATNGLRSSRYLKTRVAAAVLVAGGLATTVSLTGASASVHSHVVKKVVISTFKSAKVGTILSDSRTLYTLKPNANACTAACHKIWIPVYLPTGQAKATAGTGVNAAKLGVKTVAGGRQVTYGGKTLFWFFEDKTAGQVKGNVTDTWGKWTDIVLVKPAGTTTTTVSGGGGGVGF